MDLQALNTLLVVVDSGSFSKAAARIGLSQSSVSLHIKAIESRLGVQIFNRNTRPPALTSHGKEIVGRARLIIRLAEGLLNRPPQPTLTDALSVGIINSATTMYLPPALAKLRLLLPTFHMKFISGNIDDLPGKVSDGLIDYAIVVRPPTLAADLHWEFLSNDPLLLMHKTSDFRSVDEIIKKEYFIRYRYDNVMEDVLDIKTPNFAQPVLESDSINVIKEMVKRGVGVSILPYRVIRSDIKQVDIELIPLGQLFVQHEIGIISRLSSGKRFSHEVIKETFSTIIKEHVDNVNNTLT